MFEDVRYPGNINELATFPGLMPDQRLTLYDLTRER